MPSRLMEGEPEIVREGWLRKSPWAQWKMKLPGVRWTRKWFVLRSGTLPGACRLEYYDNETKKKPKKDNCIDLGHCIQVDSYLIHEAGKNKVYKWIFDVKLEKRQYYLVASSEQEMNAWVHDLCHVCNLEREEQTSDQSEGVSQDRLPDGLQDMLNHNMDSGMGSVTSTLRNEYLMRNGNHSSSSRSRNSYSLSQNDLDRLEDFTPETEEPRLQEFVFPETRGSHHQATPTHSVGSASLTNTHHAHAHATNSLPRRGPRSGSAAPAGNYQRPPTLQQGPVVEPGQPYMGVPINGHRLHWTTSNGSAGSGPGKGGRAGNNLRVDSTSGKKGQGQKGYVQLSDCLSAEPRPGRREIPSTWNGGSQLPPSYDAPPSSSLAPAPAPAPINGNHTRGASSDSTTSSLQLSVNSDELNTTSEGDTNNTAFTHSHSASGNLGSRSASFGAAGGTSPPARPPKPPQVSLNAVVPPPKGFSINYFALNSNSQAEEEALYSNELNQQKMAGPGSYDAPPVNPTNIFAGPGGLPKSRSAQEAGGLAGNGNTGSLPRPPKAGTGMPVGYTPMQGKMAFYESMNPWACLDDDFPLDNNDTRREETYLNTSSLTPSEGELSPPLDGAGRGRRRGESERSSGEEGRKTSAPPTVDRSLKPERRTRESEGSTTSGGGPSPPPVVPERLKPIRSSSGSNIVNGRLNQVQHYHYQREGGGPGKVYRNHQGHTDQGVGVGEKKPPPVPDKPRITVERRESFVKKYTNGNCPQPAKVPKNLPKTSVKPRHSANNSANSPNPNYPMGLSGANRSPVKGPGIRHHQAAAISPQHRMASKSESELVGSAPNSAGLQPPRNKPLEYIEVDTPPMSARTPSPAAFLIDSDGGRDSPTGGMHPSPQQRRQHYALIDETATKAVKTMIEDQQKFRSLERDKNKHKRLLPMGGRPH